VKPLLGFAVVDVELELDVALEPQAPRIVATKATAAQRMIVLRRYTFPPLQCDD
jgi:hypothetical protein